MSTNGPASPEPETAHLAARILAKRLREGGGVVRLQVQGPCMAPLIQDGDIVTCEGAREPLRRGQIVVAFDADGRSVCHRILSLCKAGMLILGSDGTSRRHQVSESEVAGVVISVERNDRRLGLRGGGNLLSRVLNHLLLATWNRLVPRRLAHRLRVVLARSLWRRWSS